MSLLMFMFYILGLSFYTTEMVLVCIQHKMLYWPNMACTHVGEGNCYLISTTIYIRYRYRTWYRWSHVVPVTQEAICRTWTIEDTPPDISNCHVVLNLTWRGTAYAEQTAN